MLWLGREDVEKVQKETFISALIEFEDGCEGYYRYQAYFLAAVSVNEFSRCTAADEIVERNLQCIFGVFDDEKQSWREYLDPIPWLAQVALLKTDINRAINTLAQKIIPTLIKNWHPNENVVIKAAEILGLMGFGNSEAISALIKLIQNEYPYFASIQITSKASESLVKIGIGNKEAIESLIRLLRIIKDKQVLTIIATTLGKIEFDSPSAKHSLIVLMNPEQKEEIRLQAARNSLEIDYVDSIAVSTLKDLKKSEQGWIREQASIELKKKFAVPIGSDEPDTISLDNIKAAEDSWKQQVALYPETITILIEQLYTTEDYNVIQLFTWVLSIVAFGEENVVKHLINLIRTTNNGLLLTAALRTLSKLLQGDLFSLAVLSLKDYVQNEDYKSDPGRYEKIYQILWFCARKMSYPDFYQAWHPTSIQERG